MSGFTWRDGERTIRFGRGTIAEAVEALGGEGYALLTTERAAAMAPGVVEAAAGVHTLGDGYVDELAGDLLGAVARERIVALGGGRVIDTAKALAAASRRHAGGDGGADDAVGRRDDAHPPPRARLRPARADRAPARGRQRPGAVGLPAARRSWRRARSTRSATPPRGRARRSPTRSRRSPPTTARGCSRAR